MPPLLLLFQADQDAAQIPFGQFMEAVPHMAFIAVHGALVLLGLVLSRRARSAGYQTVGTGFLLFCLAELSYITYHLGNTHFLFAHTMAEVLDALAVLSIGVGIAKR